MRGRGNGSSHGFGTRCGGALLGFGDALIVAKLLAVGLGGRERGLGAGRDRIVLLMTSSTDSTDRPVRLAIALMVRHLPSPHSASSLAISGAALSPRPLDGHDCTLAGRSVVRHHFGGFL